MSARMGHWRAALGAALVAVAAQCENEDGPGVLSEDPCAAGSAAAWQAGRGERPWTIADRAARPTVPRERSVPRSGIQISYLRAPARETGRVGPNTWDLLLRGPNVLRIELAEPVRGEQ